MSKFFSMKWTDPVCSSKGHSPTCGCKVVCEGIHPLTLGLKYEAMSANHERQMAEVGAFINSSITLNDQKQWIRVVRDPEQDYLRLRVPTDSTVRIHSTPPLQETFNWSYPVVLGSMSYKVHHAMKKADIRYLRKRFPLVSLSWGDCQKYIWAEFEENEVPPLQWMILRQWSTWRFAFGLTKGRLPVVAAMETLYPYKASDARLLLARRPAPEKAKEALVHVTEALNIQYQKMKVRPMADIPAILSFAPLRAMYLGSSNGVNSAPHFSIPVPKGCNIHVSGRGKKIDTFEADVLAILDFIRTGKEPPVWWNVTDKNENFFSFVKMLSDDEYSKWRNKLRVFIIPSSIYVLVEKLTSQLRMYKERGWVIQIGHRWGHGGSVRLARCLGINLANCFKPLCWEGDVSNFDQSVIEYFLNLYSSFDLAYYDPNSDDFPIFQMLNKWLTKNLIVRITHLMGELWADIEGGVPSGIYRTSAMDSWIMSLYYFLYCVWAIHNAPFELRPQLEEILHDLVFFIVYGDDHNGNPGDNPLAQLYFGGAPFAKFMNEHFGVVIRDLKTNLPFCSRTYHGWLTDTGLTFLKHQHVLNPLKQSGDPLHADQADFIPFRESREFIVRAIWGRETKKRDELDVIMSCVGHAYGTYGSNRDAYERLSLMYEELLWVCDVAPGQVMSDILHRISVNDMKKLRQMGITSDQILAGFPTWETITSKNTVDWVYQDITNRPIEDDSWDNADWDLAFC